MTKSSNRPPLSHRQRWLDVALPLTSTQPSTSQRGAGGSNNNQQHPHPHPGTSGPATHIVAPRPPLARGMKTRSKKEGSVSFVRFFIPHPYCYHVYPSPMNHQPTPAGRPMATLPLPLLSHNPRLHALGWLATPPLLLLLTADPARAFPAASSQVEMFQNETQPTLTNQSPSSASSCHRRGRKERARTLAWLPPGQTDNIKSNVSFASSRMFHFSSNSANTVCRFKTGGRKIGIRKMQSSMHERTLPMRITWKGQGHLDSAIDRPPVWYANGVWWRHAFPLPTAVIKTAKTRSVESNT